MASDVLKGVFALAGTVLGGGGTYGLELLKERYESRRGSDEAEAKRVAERREIYTDYLAKMTAYHAILTTPGAMVEDEVELTAVPAEGFREKIDEAAQEHEEAFSRLLLVASKDVAILASGRRNMLLAIYLGRTTTIRFGASLAENYEKLIDAMRASTGYAEELNLTEVRYDW
jgi:hypothetical protein